MPDRRSLRLYLAEVGRVGGDPEAVTGAVAAHLAHGLHVRPVGALARLVAAGEPLGDEARRALLPPPALCSPWLLGPVHEALLARGERRRAGAFYTPPELARRLVGWTLEEVDGGAPVCCDPACGGGAFLLAAAEHLAAAGATRGDVVGAHLYGCDADPGAVAVAAAALLLWSGGDGAEGLGERLIAGDALATDPPRWRPVPGGAFDAVIGNPPFLNQLAAGTARPRDAAASLRTRLGPAAAGYADTSALFLAGALDLVRPGGVVGLVQPLSLLAARDARGVRELVGRRASIRRVWLEDAPVFDAGTRVCAPVLVVDHPDRPGRDLPAAPVTVVTGVEDVREEKLQWRPGAGSWSPLLARALGVPPAPAVVAGTVGDLATATADFRDQYYAIKPFVREAAEVRDGAPLVTVGLIDAASCRWGATPVRFAKQQWHAPVVDLDAAASDSSVQRWLSARRVPKILVATQTPTIEAAVDTTGAWAPSTPVITVTTQPDDLWRVAAVLLAPAVSAWAFHRAAGTALARRALKLSARQVLEVPLPGSPAAAVAWPAAAASVARASRAVDAPERARHLRTAGEAMNAAYGIDGGEGDELLDWWAGRLIVR